MLRPALAQPCATAQQPLLTAFCSMPYALALALALALFQFFNSILQHPIHARIHLLQRIL